MLECGGAESCLRGLKSFPGDLRMYQDFVLTVFLSCLGSFVLAKFESLKIDVVYKPETCDRLSGSGDMLTMHYTGFLETDGSKFDSSLDRKQPFVFQLGKKQVIPGWEQGVSGMCVGEKRKLHVPYTMAYGEQGAGEKIPPNTDLIFDVELEKIEDAPPSVNVFKQIDGDKDNLLSREEVSYYLKKQIPADVEESGLEGFDQDKMVEEIFQHEDKDRDGFISHDEFSGPKHDEL